MILNFLQLTSFILNKMAGSGVRSWLPILLFSIPAFIAAISFWLIHSLLKKVQNASLRILIPLVIVELFLILLYYKDLNVLFVMSLPADAVAFYLMYKADKIKTNKQ